MMTPQQQQQHHHQEQQSTTTGRLKANHHPDTNENVTEMNIIGLKHLFPNVVNNFVHVSRVFVQSSATTERGLLKENQRE